MAEFRLSSFMISIIIFSMVVGALVITYADLGYNYHVTVDTSINKTYNQILAVENTTLALSDKVQEDTTQFDTFVLASKAIISMPKIVLNTLGVATHMLYAEDGVVRLLGIPTIFVSALITILSILLVFAIMSIWSRYRT